VSAKSHVVLGSSGGDVHLSLTARPQSRLSPFTQQWGTARHRRHLSVFTTRIPSTLVISLPKGSTPAIEIGKRTSSRSLSLTEKSPLSIDPSKTTTVLGTMTKSSLLVKNHPPTPITTVRDCAATRRLLLRKLPITSVQVYQRNYPEVSRPRSTEMQRSVQYASSFVICRLNVHHSSHPLSF
jgi:hypothetical protein